MDRRTRAGDGFGGSRTFGFGDALDLALRVRRLVARVSDRGDARFERKEKTNAGNGARSFFERPLAKFVTRARAFGATCATAYLRARAEHRSARLEAFLFEAGCDRDQSTGSRGDGRGGETRGGDARANRVFKAEREK